MRKKYEKLCIIPLEVAARESILAASVTDVPILSGEVKVEDYHNGFEEETNGFKTLDFD